MKNLAATFFLIVLAAPAYAGGIHKWVDENGRTHYGDKPPAKATSERIGTASTVPVVDRPAPSEAELLDAIDKRDADLVATLIKEGAKVTQKALYKSAQSNEPAIVETLLNAREIAISAISPEPAGIQYSMNIYHNQLMSHAVAYNAEKVVRMLAQRGANTTGGDAREPLLINAVRRGNAQAVAALLDGGADVNEGRGWALRIAAEGGDVPVVKVLLRAGANTNVAGNNYPAGPPLKDATRRGHTDVIELLQAHGAAESQQAASKN